MKARLLKTAAKGLILGASVFAFAGAAGAATNINLYGASAQFNYWNGGAASFLTSTLGCTGGTAQYTSKTDSNSKVTVAQGCPAAISSDNGVSDGVINFSYSSKASYDGIDSILGVWDAANNGGAAQPCDPTNTVCCSTLTQRPVATYDTTSSTNASSQCQTITIGTSDVDASSFKQTSSGLQFGPLGGPATSRSFSYRISGKKFSGINVSSLAAPATPLAYPFAFYVNPQVTSGICNSNSPIAAKINSFCYDDRNCGGSIGGNSYCQPETITNLSRLQVTALFGGFVKNWNDFGSSFVNIPVTICYRHAGSGTHATLDLGVMEGNGWGYGLLTSENPAGNGDTPPYVYFNDGTSDMKNCLSWASGNKSFSGVTSMASLDFTAVGGAVGYMDADNANVTGQYVQVNYNGVAASRIAMHDGLYDDFFAVNRMYVSNLSTAQQSIYSAILTYLENPNNITDATVGGTRGETYGTSGELNFPKPTDAGYPSYSPSSSPATPN